MSRQLLFVLLAACQVTIDDATVAQEAIDAEGPHVPCAPVTISASAIHATALQPALTASVVSPKPGGYLWEFDDACQGRIVAGQSTTGITFDAGFSGCTMTVHATDAQNCTGTRRLQVDFTDVGLFHTFIDNVAGNDAMRGCGGGKFCPDAMTLREEMARILLRARAVIEGRPDYQPPACVPTSQREFADVPFTNPYCPWIEQAAQDHITAGCGNGNYCPTTPVTRAQVAVLLLAAKEGPSYNPRPCVDGQELFLDVDNTSVFCPWIEEFARRGITGGCGGGNYCPSSPVTRGQMAVFVKQSFNLQFP